MYIGFRARRFLDSDHLRFRVIAVDSSMIPRSTESVYYQKYIAIARSLLDASRYEERWPTGSLPFDCCLTALVCFDRFWCNTFAAFVSFPSASKQRCAKIFFPAGLLWAISHCATRAEMRACESYRGLCRRQNCTVIPDGHMHGVLPKAGDRGAVHEVLSGICLDFTWWLSLLNHISIISPMFPLILLVRFSSQARVVEYDSLTSLFLLNTFIQSTVH